MRLPLAVNNLNRNSILLLAKWHWDHAETWQQRVLAVHIASRYLSERETSEYLCVQEAVVRKYLFVAKKLKRNMRMVKEKNFRVVFRELRGKIL